MGSLPPKEAPLASVQQQAALEHTGMPTPFANITAAEKRQAMVRGLCAACFFFLSGMHGGKRDKINLFN